MKILDVMTSPWAIHPGKMAEIRKLYRAGMRVPRIDWKDMEARVSGVLGEREKAEAYQVMNGVAVIPVKGPLMKGRSFFSFLFGGGSMKDIARAFQAAIDDPQVREILLDVDSPGGTVDGTEELAEDIFKARGVKPVTAYTDGMMASGAYWIASAADRIYISGDTVEVGSIGVVATHIDVSKADEQWGEQFTEITAGKYKRIASMHRPLTDEGAQYIQEQVDYLYDAFVAALARNRGVSREEVLAMADGRIFIGKQAVEVGLADGIEAFSDLIESAGSKTNQNIIAKEDGDMTLEELKQKYPEAYAAAIAAGKTEGMAEGRRSAVAEAAAGNQAAAEEARAQGAAAERKRIADIKAQLIPGHEALVEEMIADGKTTGPEAAVRIVAAEKALRQGKLDAFKKDGELNVASPAAPDPLKPAAQGKKDFMGEVERTMKEKKVGRGAAVSMVAQEQPELHEAYLASLVPVRKSEAK